MARAHTASSQDEWEKQLSAHLGFLFLPYHHLCSCPYVDLTTVDHLFLSQWKHTCQLSVVSILHRCHQRPDSPLLSKDSNTLGKYSERFTRALQN